MNYSKKAAIPQLTTATTEPADRLIDLQEAASLMGLQYYSLLTARSGGRLLLPIVRPSPSALRVRLSDVMRVVRGEVAATGPANTGEGRDNAIKSARSTQLAEARAARAAKKAAK